MAGFLFESTNYENKGDRNMMQERRNRRKKGFLSLLDRSVGLEVKENAHLEQLLRASYENPETFQEQWLQPLLSEGLNLDQAYELVVEGTLHPN